MTDKKRAVGVVVLLTDVPNMGRVALLQRRGEFNHEKMAPESWPGACQVTAHGGVNDGESLKEALYRELREELGELAGTVIQAQGGVMAKACSHETDKKLVVTYAVQMPASFLQCVRLGPSSGGLVLMPKDKVRNIHNLNLLDKKEEGVTNRKLIAMFPDEKEAVKKAFEMFK